MQQCRPGDLHISNGNDDESLISVAGDFASYLDGKILPGAKKSGDAEYSIESRALGEEFYMESYCGDPDFIEPAYFIGVIERP